MSRIYFQSESDAEEIMKALNVEGYQTVLARHSATEPDEPEWALTVEPFDERVIHMVDVYGGWLPGDERLTDM